MIVKRFVVCLSISPVFCNLSRHVRIVLADSRISLFRDEIEVTNCPLLITIPCQRLSSKLAFKSRCRKSLTMFVSLYHSQSRKRRNTFIQPSSIVVKSPKQVYRGGPTSTCDAAHSRLPCGLLHSSRPQRPCCPACRGKRSRQCRRRSA